MLHCTQLHCLYSQLSLYHVCVTAAKFAKGPSSRKAFRHMSQQAVFFDTCLLSLSPGLICAMIHMSKQAGHDAHILVMSVLSTSYRSKLSNNLPQCGWLLVQNALAAGFDFVVAPLARSKYRRRPTHALAPGLLHAPFTRDEVMMASGDLNRQASRSCR